MTGANRFSIFDFRFAIVLLAMACSQPVAPSAKLLDESCFLRSDYQNLPRPRLTWRRSAFRKQMRTVLSGFLVGTGDRLMATGGDAVGRHLPLYQYARREGATVNAQAIWLTRDWEDSWVSHRHLEHMAKEGVVPVLILYYFGGDITRELVLQQREQWYFYLMKVAALASIESPVLVVMEPEFNDETNEGDELVINWTGFNELLIDGMYLVRSMAPNVLVGLCPGDFGIQDLEASVGEAVQFSDFIAFQEMRASTEASLITGDYEDVTERSLTYAVWLNETFDKPILLAYVAVSTYDPDASAWEQYQADIVGNLFAEVPDLQSHGVFGMLYFSLFDDPAHEGYFGEAEKHFGLLRSDGSPKPAWDAFKTGAHQFAKLKSP